MTTTPRDRDRPATPDETTATPAPTTLAYARLRQIDGEPLTDAELSAAGLTRDGTGYITPEPTEPSTTPPEREGTCLTCRSFGGVGITSDDGEDVFGECGEGVTQRSHGVWSNFGCRLHRSRLTATVGPGGLILEAEDVARLTGVLNLTHALVNSTVNVASHNIDQVRRDVDRLRALLDSREGA